MFEHKKNPYTEGESCSMCPLAIGARPTHKIGEEIPSEEEPPRHNFTAYVCCYHFGRVFGPAAREWCSYDPIVSGAP
jgi:hypothetical protein